MARWWGGKPAQRVESIAERKIREAMERGEFDDLPGQGKPLKLGDRDPNWWVKGLLEREQCGRWAYFPLNRDAVDRLAAVSDLKGACC